MRKLVILAALAATTLPAGVSAQTRHDVARQAQYLREARQDLRRAEQRGDRHDVRRGRRDVQEARRDYREELRDYRQRNRQLYRQGSYAGPRGYRYQPVTVGGRLAQPLYARSYHVANPGRFRLPPLARNQQWVRHGNDVLLVDMRSGRVLDANRNFFW